MSTRKAVLKSEIQRELVELMIKSRADNVMISDESTETVADRLASIISDLSTKTSISDVEEAIKDKPDKTEVNTQIDAKVKKAIDDLVDGAPSTYNTLNKIATYLIQHQEYYTELAETVAKKVDKVQGKGLSTEDFTSELKHKLDLLVNYVLPPATASTLGGIKVGTNLNVDSDGLLSVPNASESQRGAVRISDSLTSEAADAAASSKAVKGLQDQLNARKKVTVSATQPGGLAQGDLWIKLIDADSAELYTRNGEGNLVKLNSVTSVEDIAGLAENYAAKEHTHTVVNGHTVECDVPADAEFTDTWRPVIDELDSESTLDSLSANQGRVLKNLIEKIKTDTENAETKNNKVTVIRDDATDTQYPSAKAVRDALAALPEPMQFKGSLGVGGTIEELPTPGPTVSGFCYKVITKGTYADKEALPGDTFICDGTEWVLIPSGDDPAGTVSSVGLSMPGAFEVSNSPITNAGTIQVKMKSEYEVPTSERATNWDNAYLHSQEAHARADATNVQSSTTNGNIKINGTETTVYEHPGTGTNPHGTTKADLGLSKVEDTKAVSVEADQGLTDTEKENARVNIGVPTKLSELENDAGFGTGTYDKPASGIPESDLDVTVQNSLAKANSALQEFTEEDPTVPSWAKQPTKPSYTPDEVGAATAAQGNKADTAIQNIKIGEVTTLPAGSQATATATTAGNVTTLDLGLPAGDTGETGTYIMSVEQTTTSTESSGINEVTCTLSNGQESTFQIKNGAKGEEGVSVSITSQAVTYQVGVSGTVIPAGDWEADVPSVSQGQFLWSRTTVNYSDGTTTTTYNVSYHGINATTTSDATQSTHGLMSAEDKTKLDGIETGATNVTSGTVSGWGFATTNDVANVQSEVDENFSGSSEIITGNLFNAQTMIDNGFVYADGEWTTVAQGTEVVIWENKDDIQGNIKIECKAKAVKSSDNIAYELTSGTGAVIATLSSEYQDVSGVTSGGTVKQLRFNTYGNRTLAIKDIVITAESQPASSIKTNKLLTDAVNQMDDDIKSIGISSPSLSYAIINSGDEPIIRIFPTFSDGTTLICAIAGVEYDKELNKVAILAHGSCKYKNITVGLVTSPSSSIDIDSEDLTKENAQWFRYLAFPNNNAASYCFAKMNFTTTSGLYSRAYIKVVSEAGKETEMYGPVYKIEIDPDNDSRVLVTLIKYSGLEPKEVITRYELCSTGESGCMFPFGITIDDSGGHALRYKDLKYQSINQLHTRFSYLNKNGEEVDSFSPYLIGSVNDIINSVKVGDVEYKQSQGTINLPAYPDLSGYSTKDTSVTAGDGISVIPSESLVEGHPISVSYSVSVAPSYASGFTYAAELTPGEAPPEDGPSTLMFNEGKLDKLSTMCTSPTNIKSALNTNSDEVTEAVVAAYGYLKGLIPTFELDGTTLTITTSNQ